MIRNILVEFKKNRIPVKSVYYKLTWNTNKYIYVLYDIHKTRTIEDYIKEEIETKYNHYYTTNNYIKHIEIIERLPLKYKSGPYFIYKLL